MSNVITCRFCNAEAPANDDAILLCPVCISDADAKRRQLDEAITNAEAHHSDLLGDLSTADTERYLAVCQARLDAKVNGTLPAFERRYQATLARGGALADLLEAEQALRRTREWAARAMSQLEALEGVAV